jgi:hypothetical protein
MNMSENHGLTLAQNDSRLALNSLIRSNATLYDYLIPVDHLFPNSNSPVYIDGVHYTAAGGVLIAQAVASVVLGVPKETLARAIPPRK